MATPTDNDEEARQRKAAENPLLSYFGGQSKQKTQPSSAAQAPTQAAPTAAKAATNVGANSQPVQPAANMQTTPAQSAPLAQPLQLQAQRSAQPTNFTNFQRYWNANADASQRTADEMGGRAAMKAAQAAQALNKSQEQFGLDVGAGTVQGPEMGGGGGSLPPDGGGGLVGESTRPTLGGDLTSTQMSEKAAGTYSGPGSLGDTKGIDDTYAKALGAQQNLNALGTEGGQQALIQQQNAQGNTGTSKFSSGLTNAAGRGDFDKLRAHFNPQGDLDKAVAKSGADADAAKALSAKNASEWAKAAGVKGTQEQEKAAWDQAQAKAATDKLDAAAKAADAVVPSKSYEQTYAKGVGGSGDTEENRTAYMMSGVDTKNPAAVAARKAQIEAYKKAMHLTDQQQLDRGFNDFNSVMSPSVIVQNAMGQQDATAKYAQGAFNKNGTASQTGSTSNNAIPWDRMGADGFFVWKSMTPEDWDTLNKLPANGGSGQRNWIGVRAQQLRDAQAASAAPKTGTTRQ